DRYVGARGPAGRGHAVPVARAVPVERRAGHGDGRPRQPDRPERARPYERIERWLRVREVPLSRLGTERGQEASGGGERQPPGGPLSGPQPVGEAADGGGGGQVPGAE